MSAYKEKVDIDRAKRVAENEQKINSILQDELTNKTEERQKREQEYYEKITKIVQKDAAKDGVETGTEGKKPQVKLPKFHMSPFTGDIIDFARFWPQFTTEIDKTKIDDISKFNYLIELLRGKPKNDVLGLPHSAEGYTEAKRILQERYGKDTVVFKQLVIELENLSAIKSVHQSQEINEFSNKFSRIVRTLKTMGKLDSAEAFVHLIFKKLGPLRENLAANCEDWEKWKMEDLADKLRKYVDRNNLNSEKWAYGHKPDTNKDRVSERWAYENKSDRNKDRTYENRSERYNQNNDRRPERHSNYKDNTFFNGENKSINRKEETDV